MSIPGFILSIIISKKKVYSLHWKSFLQTLILKLTNKKPKRDYIFYQSKTKCLILQKLHSFPIPCSLKYIHLQFSIINQIFGLIWQDEARKHHSHFDLFSHLIQSYSSQESPYLFFLASFLGSVTSICGFICVWFFCGSVTS